MAGPDQLLGKQKLWAISSGPLEFTPTAGTVPVTVDVAVLEPDVTDPVGALWAHAEAQKRATERTVEYIMCMNLQKCTNANKFQMLKRSV